MAEEKELEARRAFGRALWSAAIQPKTDLSPEERKQSWQDHKKHYVQHAHKLLQSLEKRGIRIVKS